MSPPKDSIIRSPVTGMLHRWACAEAVQPLLMELVPAGGFVSALFSEQVVGSSYIRTSNGSKLFIGIRNDMTTWRSEGNTATEQEYQRHLQAVLTLNGMSAA